MNTAPADVTEDEAPLRLPRVPLYTPPYNHNVRAMPQLSEHYRDKFGPFPMITVSGAWLRTFGFHVGVQIRIEATDGMIVLKPLWNREPIGPVTEASEKPTVRYTEVVDR